MGLMSTQSTNDLSIMIGGDAGQGVESSGAGFALALARAGLHVFALQDYRSRIRGGLDKTEGGLDLFVAYSTDEAIDRSRCVFRTLKSTLDDRQSELISIHLPDSIQQIYAES